MSDLTEQVDALVDALEELDNSVRRLHNTLMVTAVVFLLAVAVIVWGFV